MEDLRAQYALLDIQQMNREHAQRLRIAIRRRFAAGMLDALDKVPGVEQVYFDFSVSQLTRALRNVEDVQAYLQPGKYAKIKSLSREEVETARAFHKAMVPMRQDLGTLREVCEEIASRVPGCNRRVHVLPRQMVQALCRQILIDPEFCLDAKGHAFLEAERLQDSTPPGPSVRPSPRL